MTKEKVKIGKKEYETLRSQLSSKDKENHSVAMALLDHCDAEESLPYVLVLYCEFWDKVEGGFEKNAPALTKQLKKLGITLEGYLESDTIYKHTKKYPIEDRRFVMEFFAPLFQTNLESWDYKFFKEIHMVFMLKEDYQAYMKWKDGK